MPLMKATKGKFVFAAFDQGQKPVIACVNKSTVDMGVNFQSLVNALQKYVDLHFSPIWGMPCNVVAAKSVGPNEWGMIFVDNADAANALGYHELTRTGFPQSKIFVKTTLSAREKVSVTASHEIAEMLIDPAVQLCAVGPRNTIYAYEVCDAVEAFSFKVDGIEMSNFQYPSWFEGFRMAGKFDHLSMCSKPFQILRGGYMPVMRNGRWTQIFGKDGERHYRKTVHPRTSSRKLGHDSFSRSKPKL